MMRKKTKFELFLAADSSLQDQCKREIFKTLGAHTKPVFASKQKRAKTRMDQFYEITLRIAENEVWDIARELACINGVLDVDPEISTSLDHNLAGLETSGEKKVKKEYQKLEAGWFHKNTRFPEAIQYAKDEYEAGRGCYQGNETGIKIGQFDTGYTNHPEVIKINKKKGRNYVAPPWWLRWLKPNWRPNAKDRLISLTPFKWASHGTSSASLIIGVKTSSRQLVKGHKDRTNGVFPFIELIPYRISDAVISFHNNMARAAEQAMIDGCKILTASHAMLFKRRMLEEMVEEAYERGIIWVAAAGSHIAKVKKIWIYPAKFPEVIAVAASTHENKPWEKTHAGVVVEICAPGYEIYRPYARRRWFGLFGHPEYAYGWGEGSTFSTPITAAAAALWLAHHGEEKLNERYTKLWQRVEAFRMLLAKSATPHLKPGDKRLYGAGILNVEKLLKTLLPAAENLVHVSRKPVRLAALSSPEQSIDYITNKELTHLTCEAKIETEDEKADELFNYVKTKSTSKACDVLDHATEMEKKYAQSSDPQLRKNPKSEALKVHIKKVS